MRKNGLLQLRHKFQTIIQIVIPILFTANLLVVRSLIAPIIDTNNTTYNAFDVDTIPIRLANFSKEITKITLFQKCFDYFITSKEL